MAQETVRVGVDCSEIEAFCAAARALMEANHRVRPPMPLFDLTTDRNTAGLIVTIAPTKRAARWLRKRQDIAIAATGAP